MEINVINNKEIWNNFFNDAKSPSFLQSWEWGEFQKNSNEEILRLGVFESNKLIALALVIKVKAKRGSFLFIPHGPIFMKHVTYNMKQFKSVISQFLNFLISLSKQQGYSFIRIAPVLENKVENQQIFQELGFRKAPIYLHAERMWVLPLASDKIISEDMLLAQMRKTTRYLIKKAAKDGVIIEKRTDEAAVDDFWKIYQITAEREKFQPFSHKFIKEEFNAFHKTGNALFLFAGVRHLEYLASALIIFTKSTAFYHQGASIHTKIPATYLLQWEAIKEAKKRGCRFYNFWGIYQESRTPKSWEGLSLFKTGFGGTQIDYLPTQDCVLSHKYYLTYLYEKFLSFKRGI